ncbi:30S ribosomal protein S1 [Vallitalea sp.]|jgi:small subunit ribosomal protein S1|uniref:30S ribosomal protein S1 n=1 Tax=Vallitalea sp. TaxID=1882829 RepID=UPI0025CF900A|nr:30S ribosomal protein S1 [Vallitalea sp.]MCT4688152.1 30S ribosomal protein S1 [Vallitalea sp.]
MDEKFTEKSSAEIVDAVDKEEVKEEIKETEVENTPSMEDYAKEIDNTFVKLAEGDIVEGKVLSVTDTEILVNIGYISDGIVPVQEIIHDEDVSLKDLYKENDIIKAQVTDLHDGEGNVLLSIKKAEQIIVWDELKEAFENKTTVKVIAKEAVKGGIKCVIKGIRAFMPGSRLSVNYVEDLNEFVGKELEARVIDLDVEKKNVILSRKELEKEELEKKKHKLLGGINKNDRMSGVVKRITNFGAFVDIGGIDGLVHINDLSWKRVKHPSEVVNVGDNVEVYVLDVDKERERISLGLKNVNDDPWLNIKEKYTEGNIYEGTVVRLLSFGAFVMLEGGIEGLVHISEIADKRIEKPEDVLEIGDKVTVKLLGIDEEGKKIKLSIKEAKDDVNKEEFNKFNDDSEISTSLKDVFKGIMDNFKE